MSSDPNIFYGGDLDIPDYPTAGDFIIKFLKLGGNRNCLVGFKIIFYAQFNQQVVFRLMAFHLKFGLLKKFSMRA
jgi:hypothetical protein